MWKRAVFMQAWVFVLLLAVACAPRGATPQPAVPAAPAPASAVPVPAAAQLPKTTKEAWQIKWDALLEAAKREGKMVMYSQAGPDLRAALQRDFKEKFGFDAEFITGQTAELGTKIVAERRAGLRLGDVIMGAGSSTLLVLKPAGLTEPIEAGGVLVLPEFSDPKLWLGGGLRWQDAEHMSLAFSMYEMHPIAGNTELIKAGEIQSYNDFLNPKWKGKIVMQDPTKLGRGLKAVAMPGRYTMGWDWVRALAKQEPLITNDARLLVEWVARGKYAIGYGVKTETLFEFKKMGLPIDTLRLREGGYLVSGTGNIALLKDAAHPNAARLFLNWWLSKEGQTVFSRVGGYPSVRLDVSDEGLQFPRVAQDSKAPDGDSEQSVLQQDEDIKIIKDIFAAFLTK